MDDGRWFAEALRSSFGPCQWCAAAQLTPRDSHAGPHDRLPSAGFFASQNPLLRISSPGTSCPLTPGSKHAKFTGTASVIRSTGTTTEPMTVEVDDCGEPGTADTFGIQTGTYVNMPPKTLIGGNIQIHKG